MLEKIRRLPRCAFAFQVRRGARHDDAARTRETHVNHVTVDRLDQANAGIESLGDSLYDPDPMNTMFGPLTRMATRQALAQP